jgi:hypothetical protein
MQDVKPVQLSGTKRWNIWKKILMSFQQTVRIKMSETCRDINKFKKVYQSRSNLVKDENNDLLADAHNILYRQKNYFCQILNVHGIDDIRQTERHTAEPLIPEFSPFEVEIAIKKLKRYKSPSIVQILEELIQAGGNTLCSEIHKFINTIWNKDELLQQWKESIIVSIYKKDDKTGCSNCRGIMLLPTTYKILTSILVSSLIPYITIVTGDHQC